MRRLVLSFVLTLLTVIGSSQQGLAALYTITDLGTLGGSWSHGYGINDNGQITGRSRISGGAYNEYHTFLYSDGVMTDLGLLFDTSDTGYQSNGSGINDSGQVTGTSGIEDGNHRAFLYCDGVMTDLGILGGTHSGGYDINNSGQVTGYSDSESGDRHAFLYSDGVMSDLGTLGGDCYGYGINDSGQVVGWSRLTDPNEPRAFLYSDGVMSDLNDLIPESSGWLLYRAEDINNDGQITGYGLLDGAATHAFLLTPSESSVIPLPASGLIWLGLFGSVVVAGWWRRRKHA